MTPEQIQKMADGLSPQSIGKDYEEAITWLANQHIALQQQVNAMAAEGVCMNKFVNDCLQVAWAAGSMDGAEVQELALKNGLLRKESYCADLHENMTDDPGNFVDGDDFFIRVETPATDAIKNELIDRLETAEKRFPELQQQVNALAAENSLASDSLSSVMRGVYRAKTYLDSNRFIDAASAILTAIEAGQRKNEAPNTDAIQNEWMTKGVENAAAGQRRLAEVRSRQFRAQAAQKAIAIAEFLESYAAHTREGDKS